MRFAFAFVAVVAVVPTARCQTERPADKDLLRLIARLGAADFRAREQADRELFQIRDPALRDLRQAAAADVPLETRRRIKRLVERIEDTLLAAEAKNWQTLDAPAWVKDCFVSIMARKSAMADAKCVEAIYLMVANRRPTEFEIEQALQEFKQRNFQTISALRIARPLVRSSGAGADMISSYAQLVEVQKDSFALDIPERAIGRFDVTWERTARTDEDLADLLYLFVQWRFPNESEVAGVVAALTKMQNRPSPPLSCCESCRTNSIGLAELPAKAKPPRVAPRVFWQKPAMTYFRVIHTIMGPKCLTAVFGMGTGVATWVWSPARRIGPFSFSARRLFAMG